MSAIIMHDFDVGIAIPERQRLAAVVARAVMNAGGFGPCGLIFVDGACPLLVKQRASLPSLRAGSAPIAMAAPSAARSYITSFVVGAMMATR